MKREDIIAAQHFEGELYIKASDHHRAVRAAVAAEREACAKLCEQMQDWPADATPYDCAAAIRARGEKK